MQRLGHVFACYRSPRLVFGWLSSVMLIAVLCSLFCQLGACAECGDSVDTNVVGVVPMWDADGFVRAGSFPDLEYAQSLLVDNVVFVSRMQAVGVADRLMVDAESKPKVVATSLARVAGDLRRKSYRTFHHVADAREAIACYRVASTSDDAMSACSARLAFHALLVELGGDVTENYALLCAESRRDRGSSCSRVARRAVDELAAFRGGLECPYEPESVWTDSGVDGETDRVVEAFLDGGLVDGAFGGAGAERVVAGGRADRGLSVLKSVDVFGSEGAARVVIRLSRSVRFEVGELPADGKRGPRLYVDLMDAKRGSVVGKGDIDGLLRRVRVAEHPDKTRVVLDLREAASKSVFYMPEPYRVVVDVGLGVGARVGNRSQYGSRRRVSDERRVVRVVLDPGHGGRDPGAIGPGGLQEKDVVLDVAHRVAPVLSREMGIVTMLTRDDDRYVALEERTAKANAFNADLFVSLHCNASEDSAVRGVQTFVLDRARDDVARRIAARENGVSVAAASEVGSVLGVVDVEPVVRRSWRLAELMQRASLASLADRYGGVVDGGVRSASFFVLLGAEMPAVLFEASYITNPDEEVRLGTAGYRQKLADGVVNALRAYREGR